MLAGLKQIIANFTGGTLHVVAGASILGLSQGPQVSTEVVGIGGFNVPSLGNTVSIPVTNSADFNVGEYLFIDSGIYLVTVLGSGTITAMYAGSAANSTVSAGVVIFIGVQNQVVSYATNPPDALMVFMWQAENYVIIVCENQKTLLFSMVPVPFRRIRPTSNFKARTLAVTHGAGTGCRRLMATVL